MKMHVYCKFLQSMRSFVIVFTLINKKLHKYAANVYHCTVRQSLNFIDHASNYLHLAKEFNVQHKIYSYHALWGGGMW